LPEVHSHYSEQRRLADTPGVDFVYDSQLPLLVLHTLFTGNTAALTNWIAIRPTNCVTTLDTHDGLPIPDVEDLLTPQEIDDTVAILRSHGGRDAMRAASATSDKKKLYQVDCTYYSALGENDDAYITARAIQFFLPGIPQVYYVGLLAGSNDTELVAKTSVSRDINRHTYTNTEISTNIKRPVVQRLFTLIKLRNSHKAFNGDFTLTQKNPNTLTMRWELDTHFCELTTNCKTHTSNIKFTISDKVKTMEL
jgi:sucrose phosphorylase